MERSQRRSSRVRLIAFSALVLGIAAIGTGLTSLALFTDQKDVTSGGFQTGTIKLGVSPASAIFTVPNMMPGDVYAVSVNVANVGSSQLRYGITSLNPTGTGPNACTVSCTSGLHTVIDMAIGQMTPAACATWNGATLPTPMGSGKLNAVSVPQSYVLNPLPAANNADLCFRASLPLGTGNGYQNQTASTTFRFDAEQTANNP
jgi:predicted ribosomally synthesized peptide with SipW-like signal peptide